MQSYFATYEDYFIENLPALFTHFKDMELTPDLYIIEWWVYSLAVMWLSHDHCVNVTWLSFDYHTGFQENLPDLFAHFKGQELTPDLYIKQIRMVSSLAAITLHPVHSSKGAGKGFPSISKLDSDTNTILSL